MRKNEKPLRWYIVTEETTGGYVVGARSHSRAKIQLGSCIIGQYSHWESLTGLSAKLLKDFQLSRSPEKEGDLFEDREELLQKGVFTHFYDE